MIRIVCVLGLVAILLSTLSATCGGRAPSSSQTINPAGQSITVLSSVKGNVTLLKAGASNWTAAVAGTRLDVNDTIRTAEGAGASVTFFDGSTVDLASATEIKLLELSRQAGSQATTITLGQEIGQTLSQVTKFIDPASRYDVVTPSAIAAVRGSSMLVIVAPDGTTSIGNIEGLVVVVAQGIEVSVPEGEHTVVMPGMAPTPPEQGLACPLVTTPGEGPSPFTFTTIIIPTGDTHMPVTFTLHTSPVAQTTAMTTTGALATSAATSSAGTLPTSTGTTSTNPPTSTFPTLLTPTALPTTTYPISTTIMLTTVTNVPGSTIPVSTTGPTTSATTLPTTTTTTSTPPTTTTTRTSTTTTTTPTTTTAPPATVRLTIHGAGSTPWAIGNVKPGDSGIKSITITNSGNVAGNLTIWLSNIVSTEGTSPEFEPVPGNDGELDDYVTFSATSSRITSNITMPTTIGNLPQSSGATNFIRVLSLRAGESVNLNWIWSLPLDTGNVVQGDGLSFDIFYLLEQI